MRPHHRPEQASGLARASGRTRLSGSWPVVRLWEQDAEQLLAAGEVGLLPWVPLTRNSQPPEVVLARCRDEIETVPDRVNRAGLLAVTQILTNLAYPDRRFLDFFGGAKVIIESPVLDEVIEILKEKYRKEYHDLHMAEGRAEGRVSEAQEAVVTNLEARFGVIPEDVRTKPAAITDLPRLKALVRLAATCPDLAAFAAGVSG